MSERKKPCLCEKGFIIRQFLTDDWNRSREREITVCEKCNPNPSSNEILWRSYGKM